MRIHIKAFGCKLNQSEAGALESAFISAGHEVCEPPCEVAIVCGCTVTSRADSKVRQYLRKLSREFGLKRLILSGCHTIDVDTDTFKKLGVEKTFSDNDPKPILAYLGLEGIRDDVFIQNYSGRTRAFVKIQDGCDNFCSYCIVPFVRGRERSIAPQIIINQINKLIDAKIKEIVLTGVHIGRYFSENFSLAKLCEKILRETKIARIRLSSVEADEIKPDLIFLMQNDRRFASHIHIPIQSGCIETLKRMNRQPFPDNIARIIDELTTKVDNISIGSDIIVGFPGESDNEFEDSYKFIESLPLSYLHIFRYSKRAKTKAYDMDCHIPEYMKQERMLLLKLLDERLRNQFGEKQIGREVEVIVEEVNKGKCRGTTSNYLKAEFISPDLTRNNLINLKVKNYKNRILYCEPIHFT